MVRATTSQPRIPCRTNLITQPTSLKQLSPTLLLRVINPRLIATPQTYCNSRQSVSLYRRSTESLNPRQINLWDKQRTMHPQNNCHSRSAHNAPEVSHSNTSHSTHLCPHSHSHVYPTQRDSYPQVGVPSAFMAELRNTAGPSGGQGSAHREEGSHIASQSSGHGARDLMPTNASRPCSSPDRHIPRQSSTSHPFTNSSSSAHRSHPYNREPHMNYG